MALTLAPPIPGVQGRERAAGPEKGRVQGGTLSGDERGCWAQSRERQKGSSSLQPLPAEVAVAMDPLSVRDPCFPLPSPPLLSPVPWLTACRDAGTDCGYHHVGGTASGAMRLGLGKKQ